MEFSFDLAVIGAGASGFMGAITAANEAVGLRVVIFEKSNKVLAKVKVSGGGRCNVTNAERNLKRFSQNYPRGSRFVFRQLNVFGPQDVETWFAERGVILKTEADGRMFPSSNSSDEVILCLQNEANKLNIDIRKSQPITRLQALSEGGFAIWSNEQEFTARYVLVASGGYPKANDYNWLCNLNLQLVPSVPSLFTFNANSHRMKHLMGVSAQTKVKIAQTKHHEDGPLLVSHWGFSGPAVLRCSAWGARDLSALNYDFDIRINWLPDLTQEEVAQWLLAQKNGAAKSKVRTKIFDGVPQRLWEHFLIEAAISADASWHDCKDSQLRKLAEIITAQPHHIRGKTLFKEEFVTAGGVALEEIDPLTGAFRRNTDVYFAGEVLDVDGITGGFNFQHAWSSGWIAGKNIAAKFKVLNNR
ncbi:MAG: NAD(P)/FAD-dependent oxidoreductase [Bacteroidia bacterium]